MTYAEKMFERKCEVYNYIEDYGIANNDELLLVIDILGFNIEALNSIIYARTGCRDMEQHMETLKSVKKEQLK